MNTLIVTGGKISLDFALTFLQDNRFECVIAADKGLELLQKIGVEPDYIIGDFDSVSGEVLAGYKLASVVRLNPEKDFTDTEAAMRLAIDKGASSIALMGATGTRIDHMLANLNLLYLALEKRIPAYIIDENNKIRLIDKSFVLYRNEACSDTVSLLPYTEEVKGITLTGFYYPLKNKNMSRYEEFSLGVSNKLTADKGSIEFESGILTVIEAKD